MKCKLITLIALFLFVSNPEYTFGQITNTSARLNAIAFIQEGDMHLQNRDWEAALFAYTNAIQADVTFAEAYMKRGQLYERTTHTQEAMNDYNMAIKLNPFIDVYYDQRARIRMLSFDYYGAVDDITKAIHINGENADYLKNQVEGFITLGRYEEALQNLDSLNQTDKEKLFVAQRKALIFLLNDDLNSAKYAVEDAYAMDDSAYLTLDLYGLIALKEKRYEEALKWFNQALEIDSTQYVSYYNRGIAYRNLGDNERALADIDKAIALNNENQKIYYKRALIRKETGDLEGAIDDYDSAIEIDPNYKAAIYNRAFTHKILGDYTSAQEDIEYIIDLPNDRPEYWNMKGNLMILHGDIRNAIPCFDRAISFDIEYAEAYYNRGIANLLFNRPVQACEDLTRSIELGFENAEVVLKNFCGHY